MDYDEELDVRGQVCPYPALKTKKALMKMKPGTILKVLIDHPPAVDSVKREIAKTKSKFLEVEEVEDDEWALYFECVK
ncbi:MAG: sulfurtransferase TusA family protein [Candidatus Thorarchaeota archaeon]